MPYIPEKWMQCTGSAARVRGVDVEDYGADVWARDPRQQASDERYRQHSTILKLQVEDKKELAEILKSQSPDQISI